MSTIEQLEAGVEKLRAAVGDGVDVCVSVQIEHEKGRSKLQSIARIGDALDRQKFKWTATLGKTVDEAVELLVAQIPSIKSDRERAIERLQEDAAKLRLRVVDGGAS